VDAFHQRLLRRWAPAAVPPVYRALMSLSRLRCLAAQPPHGACV